MDAPAASGHLFDAILAAVCKIPHGRVATYGGISLLVTGSPHAARTVGWALHSLLEGNPDAVPWWRVINRHGRISNTGTPTAAAEQRARLEAEGIAFSDDARVDLTRYGWFGEER